MARTRSINFEHLTRREDYVITGTCALTATTADDVRPCRVQNTLVPLHAVVNREYLHHRIDELHAEGYTNISGGLMEGCAAVKKRPRQRGQRYMACQRNSIRVASWSRL